MFLLVLAGLQIISGQLEEPAGLERPDAGQPTVLDRLEALEKDNRQLRHALQRQDEQLASAEGQLFTLLPLKGRLKGYLDLGFFWVEGDGSGIRSDIGYGQFPEYRGVVPDSWVFMGDPLSTAINARGDPADTGESRAVVFDPIHSRGKPSAIVNTLSLSLSLFAGLGEDLTLNATIDFVPRTRIISDKQGTSFGDFIDVKLAYVEYLAPFEAVHLTLSAGKFDSVLGIEYRSQDAPDRLTVTPSLLCRYTCGHPIGIKARGLVLDDRLIVNLAVTNGSSFSEGFGFNTETDTNFFKTVSGRISYRFPIGTGVELGASGSVGAQDAQPDDDVVQWHYGFDLHAELGDLDLTAEVVKGHAPGKTESPAAVDKCAAAPCISYRAGYVQAGYRLTNWLMPYVRADGRDALHRNGASFVYISQVGRLTFGGRFELGEHVVLKAEYTFNLELAPAASIPNNVFSSSAVIKF